MRVFLKLFAVFFIFSFVSLLSLLCMYIDTNLFGFKYIVEISATEIFQELVLAGICLIYILNLKDSRNFRRLNILILGFFTVILIREMDFIFDKVSHGSWIYPALVVAIISLILAFIKPKELVSELDDYIKTQSFVMMLCGVFMFIAFSRLFGTSMFWKHILEGESVTFVKHIVQEGLETLGYTICLISALMFRKQELKLKIFK